MVDVFLDLPAGDGLLQAIIAHWVTSGADIARGAGKLKEGDAKTLRRLEAHLDNSAQQLREFLLRVAPADAAEGERLVAQIVRDAGKIWHLLPMPSPNARDFVTVQVRKAENKTKPAVARAGKLLKTRREAEISKAVFAERHFAENGNRKGIMKEVHYATAEINKRRDQQRLPMLSESQVRRHLLDYLKSR